VLTLAQVLADNHAPPAFELLKVDVEGLEQAVLAGNDWLRFRPRVVMIEATVPETPIRRQDGCRAFLTAAGWRHAWFDGLNDWYLAPDFEPPAGAFDAPLNIFDRYATRRTVEAEAAVRSLQAENARLRVWLANVSADLAKHNKALAQVQSALVSTRQEVADARAESKHFREVMTQLQADVAAARAETDHFRELMTQAQAQSAALHQELNALHTSTSWRVSAPVRVIGRMLRAAGWNPDRP
jgi:hypothetical protein